jgi:hypothetical protein
VKNLIRKTLIHTNAVKNPGRLLRVFSTETRISECIFSFLLCSYALFLQLSVKDVSGLPYDTGESTLYLVLSLIMLVVAAAIIIAQESMCYRARYRANLAGACLWGGILGLFFYDQPLSTGHGTYGALALSQLVVASILLWKYKNPKAFPCRRNPQLCKYRTTFLHKA